MRIPYWQQFGGAVPDQVAWTDRYPAAMPDGRTLWLPLRDFGDVSVAGLIANQASFVVLDQLAAWVATAAQPLEADIVVGLPTLGHTVGAAVARALGAQRYAVFGHSYGAFVALQQAVNEPGAAASIVCCGVPSSSYLDDIPAKLETFLPLHLREQVRASWASEASVETEADFARIMDEQLPWHFGNPEDPRIPEYARRSAGRYAPDVLRKFSAAGYGGIEVQAALGSVTSPVLVLAGRHDRTCPPEASQATAAGVPGAALHIFEESGHMPFVEQPEEFLAVVRSFLVRALK